MVSFAMTVILATAITQRCDPCGGGLAFSPRLCVWINARKYMINTDRKSVRTNADKYASADSTPTTSHHNHFQLWKVTTDDV